VLVLVLVLVLAPVLLFLAGGGWWCDGQSRIRSMLQEFGRDNETARCDATR